MKSSLPVLSPWFKRFLALILLALSTTAIDFNRASAQSAPCSLYVSPEYLGQACCWRFVFRNYNEKLRVFNINARILVRNGSVESASAAKSFVETTTTTTSVNWAFPNGLGTDLPDTGFVCFKTTTGSLRVAFAFLDENERAVCRDTIDIECPREPCFEIGKGAQITCTRSADNQPSWTYTFDFLNNSGCTVSILEFAGVKGINLDPVGFEFDPLLNHGDAAKGLSLKISGPGAEEGRVVAIPMLMLGPKECECRDTLKIELPTCPALGCAEILPDAEVECTDLPGAGPAWTYTFGLKNTGDFDVRYIGLSGAPGAKITPGTIELPAPLAPGESITDRSITITGVQSGPFRLYLALANEKGSGICYDTVDIVLPKCTIEDCLAVTEGNVVCVSKPGEPALYEYTFNITNQAGCLATHVYVDPADPNADLQIGPKPLELSPALAAGETYQGVKMNISGGDAAGGETIRLAVSFVGPQQCFCADTIDLALPPCGDPVDDGCLSLLDRTAECDDPVAVEYKLKDVYITSYSMLGSAGSDAATSVRLTSLVPAGGVQMQPSVIQLPKPMRKGDTATVEFRVVGATSGAFRYLVEFCDDNGNCCDQEMAATLPECVNLSAPEVMDEGAAFTLREASPNPSSGSVTFQFHLSRSADNVALVLTDGTGRPVAEPMYRRALEAGEHALTFDVSSLPSGAYFYTLHVDGRTETRGMQVVK